MVSATMVVPLGVQLNTKLQKFAKAIHRDSSILAVEAISEYLKIQQWQITEIKKGITEADAGHLIGHKEVVRYWEKKRAHMLDKKR